MVLFLMKNGFVVDPVAVGIRQALPGRFLLGRVIFSLTGIDSQQQADVSL
jgi:hypothetical protein